MRRRLHLAVLPVCAAVALSGCQGVSVGLQYAEVRFLDVSPDAPELDVYQNGSPLLYSIGFGTASAYVPVGPGTYSYSVHTAGLHQQLGSAGGTLVAGGQYTVLVGNTAAALQVTLLKDQSAPTPAGQLALRILHQSTRSRAVDVYLVPPGGKLASTVPLAAGITFGSSPAYISTAAGTYSIVVLPAGSSPAAPPPPIYSGNQLEYLSGAARTIVLIDAPTTSLSALQVLTADDVTQTTP